MLIGLALFGLASVSQAEEPTADEFNCDDDPSCLLQVKAWDALGAGKYEVAVSFAAACASLNEDDARAQQASLSEKVADGGYATHAALNHAGTCYFIKGEALGKMNKKAEAMAAFKTVIDDLSYSQAWDPQGWFWTVADAAKESAGKL